MYRFGFEMQVWGAHSSTLNFVYFWMCQVSAKHHTYNFYKSFHNVW